MGFPPGLLPELVREKLRTDAPYSPLSPLDIERAALPPPAAPDAYLAARLDKFHAELRVRTRFSCPTLPCEGMQRASSGAHAV